MFIIDFVTTEKRKEKNYIYDKRELEDDHKKIL